MCPISDTPRNTPASEEHPFSSYPIRPGTTVTLLGGDARQLSVADALVDAGCSVRIMGVGEDEPDANKRGLPVGARLCHSLSHALEGTSVLVLPYPTTKDGVTVSCPLDTRCRITLEELTRFLSANPAVRVFGGRLPHAFTESLRQSGCRVTDYEESEAFLIKNARLTAEGAVMTAMELTDTALLGAKVAVIGYGRIGQLLAGLLKDLGAHVTVVARREESLALAEANGMAPCAIKDMLRLCTGYGVIFNTVPAVLMSKELLCMMPCRTLIMELASAPGGLDPEGAREATRRCGLQIMRAPSLPGRYAPVDAGYAIADCILSVLSADALFEDREVGL